MIDLKPSLIQLNPLENYPEIEITAVTATIVVASINRD